MAVAAGALVASGPGQAQEAPRQAYNIEAESLADALRAVSRLSGREIMFPAEAVDGRRAPNLVGIFTLEDAIGRLLEGTDLVAVYRDNAVLIRGRALPPSEVVDRPAGTAEVLVTGSRIKGTPPTSPVIILSADQIRTAGQSDLGEAIRSLPQNFAGGQNPGVTITASGTNQNVTGGSALNLRGLGPDASLTLLNGHRLAYDYSTQGIDISAIPLAAVDRVEIVADGNSALYGSDAVGGVANVILRTDFNGLDARVRFGAATDGGLAQQGYSLVGGRRWSSGGVLVAADYSHSTQISARQRSYTAAVPDDTTLYPAMDHVGVVGSARQALGSGVSVDVDAYYSRRRSPVFASFGDDSYTHDGTRISSETKSFGVSPRLGIDLFSGWHGDLRGTYGFEHGYLLTNYFSGSSLFLVAPVHYENRLKAVEANIDGGLVSLPAGMVKLALGGGYRSVGLSAKSQSSIAGGALSTVIQFDKSQNALFGYGELYVPLISAAQDAPAVERLSLTAAGRFERYDRFGSVFTPKLGLIYSPVPALDIKASWGRSFKAPTLQQTALSASAVLTRASGYASGYPAAAAVLYSDGGNPDLRAEHATTWTTTIGLHPTFWGGAKIEISYFNVRYRDRVLSPIGVRSGSLTNPLYRDLVTLNPSAAQIDAIIARSPAGLVNNTSFPFAYANVVAIQDNRYRNIARFTAKGIDVSASIPIDLDAAGRLLAASSVSYLESAQNTVPGGAALQRAGTIGNPPHWRMRSSLAWTLGSLTVAPALTYIGDVADNRSSNAVTVGSMTTVDLTARYKIEREGPFHAVEISLSVLNLFNTAPAPIAVSAYYLPAYDSANYSAIGRSVGITMAKQW